MSKTFDVCVYGSGVVGQVLALQLAQAKLRVALLQRPPSPAIPDVRAYALNAASRAQLQGLRSWPGDAFATPVQSMQVAGDDGGQVTFDASDLSAAKTASSSLEKEGAALAWIVDIPALEHQLAQAIRYQPQIDCISDDGGAADSIKAPLRVICEGQHGASLAALPVHRTVKQYPQRAIAARLTSTQPHGGAARQWFQDGDVLALLPMEGPGGHGLALVWSVATERAALLESLSADDFCVALQAACGPEVGPLQLTSPRASWALSLSTAARWVGPGWALAGDAAHTVHPLAGQGLNLGLADVACLASVLAGREYWRSLGDERLLRRYERARKADVAAMASVTDGLYTLFSHTHGHLSGPLQVARNWGMTSFARSGPFRRWVTQRAAGHPPV